MDGWWARLVATLLVVAAPGDQDSLCSVLGGLDLVRTQAVATDRPDRLDDVYVDPALLRRDRAVAQQWSARGLRLAGGLPVRHACSAAERTDVRARLVVVESLGPTWAVASDGERRRLPRDGATRRVVTLVATPDGWRVRSVR